MLATEYDKQPIPTQQVVQLPFLGIRMQIYDEDGADIVGGNDVIRRVGDGRGGELVTEAVAPGEGSVAVQPDDGGTLGGSYAARGGDGWRLLRTRGRSHRRRAEEGLRWPSRTDAERDIDDGYCT